MWKKKSKYQKTAKKPQKILKNCQKCRKTGKKPSKYRKNVKIVDKLVKTIENVGIKPKNFEKTG